MRHFLIDTDTASDDAVALIMALNHPDIKVEAISVIAGNIPLEQAVQNALYTVEIVGANVPVYAGLDKPLIRPLETATYVHGKDGLGDIGLPLHGRTPASMHAVNAIIKTVNQFPGTIELITIGPLSNIAVAFMMDPTLPQKIKHCYVMGGTGQGPGNVTPVSEFNIWVDPEAAKLVFESGMPITMIGWDIALNHAVFDMEDLARYKAMDTKLAHFSMDIQKQSIEFSIEEMGYKSFNLPDPIAMAVAIDDSVVLQRKEGHIDILLSNDQSRGQTVVNYKKGSSKLPLIDVVLEVDRNKFVEQFESSIK